MVRFILGSILIYASIDKIAFPGEFLKAVQAYTMLPKFLISPIVIILPWIELIAGIFLITAIFLRQTALFITFLLVLFLVSTIIGFMNGTLLDCGCFSKSQFLYTDDITLVVIRDLLLIGMSIFLSFPVSSNKYKNLFSSKVLRTVK